MPVTNSNQLSYRLYGEKAKITMQKSDLRSGMLVTLRNKEHFYVMLNTCLYGDHYDILVHKVGDDTGWLPLRNYASDLTFHDDPDSIFPSTPEEDAMWDIMTVARPRHASDMCIGPRYAVIWTRSNKNNTQEELPMTIKELALNLIEHADETPTRIDLARSAEIISWLDPDSNLPENLNPEEFMNAWNEIIDSAPADDA